MLTGLLAPTSGEIIIDGRNLHTELESLRRIMGVCPQTNILWKNLTVQEHLNLFGRLRGLTSEEIHESSIQLLEMLEMLHLADCYASNLSGGQKRKLMIMQSFLGNPSFILLDEPR